MINYREYYKQYYNIDFSDDYDIHHIDLDRNNNSIENLLLIPKSLHLKYHNAIKPVSFICDKNIQLDKSIWVNFNAKITTNAIQDCYQLEVLETLIPILWECNVWGDYKAYLDGKIGNIHNIVLKI